MLVLDREGDSYPDHGDPQVRYRLPMGLTPLAASDGTPQAMLSRGPEGGLLHLRLAAAWPPMQPHERPVGFAGGRFRLLVRTPTSSEAGRWRTTAVTGAAVIDRGVSLDPVEAALARSLGRQTGDLVEVEAELEVRGLAPAYPWLVSADAAMLLARIAALLGDKPATWEAVVAAFLGLTDDIFTWYPLAPGALRPSRDEALVAIAHYAAPELLTDSGTGWVPATGRAGRVNLSLGVPRTQSRTVGLRWSFSEFLAAQPDPARHVIDVTVPAPFVAAEITVANDVPLAAAGISSIALEIRTGGPTGVLRHEFRAGEPSGARLRFVRESAEELKVRWRARVTVTTAGGPAVIDIDERAGGLMIEITPATLGLHALQFLATADVFDHAPVLEVTIGTRVLALTAAAPAAWAVGRTPPTNAGVAVVLASGERHPLGMFPVGARGLTVDAGALGVGEVVPVVLRPPADLAQRAAYLAVQVEGQSWRSLEVGSELTSFVRRINRFMPARLRYRTRQVARGADGATRVISESTWRVASGETVAVEL